MNTRLTLMAHVDVPPPLFEDLDSVQCICRSDCGRFECVTEELRSELSCEDEILDCDPDLKPVLDWLKSILPTVEKSDDITFYPQTSN